MMLHDISNPVGCWFDPVSSEEIPHARLLKRLAGQQVVLLGENHDQADMHRWQLHVAAGLLAHRPDLVLGFEMFPVSVQPMLDAWVSGVLTEERFLDEVDWKTIWGFPAGLYLPLFQFCRQFRIPMKALNCRRTLVSEVGKMGWDAIPEPDRDGLTPAKAATNAYRRYLFDSTGGGMGPQKATSPDDPSFDRFVRAQQTWDRAFACNIRSVLDQTDPPLVIGIIGRGHLEYGHGTPYQLRDLDVDAIKVLLPCTTEELGRRCEQHADCADALFCLGSTSL
jgi:uncharacterized iron-regulated protein